MTAQTNQTDFQKMWEAVDAKKGGKTSSGEVVTATVVAPQPAPAVAMVKTVNNLQIPRAYLDGQKLEEFPIILILNAMINDRAVITVAGEGMDGEGNALIGNRLDRVLDPLLTKMYSNGLIEMVDRQNVWRHTQKGLDFFKAFMARYSSVIGVYDVFTYVDLVGACFAHTDYFKFDSDGNRITGSILETGVPNDASRSWWDFVGQQVADPDLRLKFRDLRITVIEYLNRKRDQKIDVVELVFMDIVERGNFPRYGEENWQERLYFHDWKELIEIVNSYPDPESIPGDMDALVKEGFKLMVWLKQEEARQQTAYQAEQERQVQAVRETTTTYTERVVEEEVVEYVEYEVPVITYPVTYYERYYHDPFYVPDVYINTGIGVTIVL